MSTNDADKHLRDTVLTITLLTRYSPGDVQQIVFNHDQMMFRLAMAERGEMSLLTALVALAHSVRLAIEADAIAGDYRADVGDQLLSAEKAANLCAARKVLCKPEQPRPQMNVEDIPRWPE